MNVTHLRHSPLHDAIAPLRPTWGAIDGMPVPLRFSDTAQERRQAQRLGLCDASALARTTLKGAAAAELLQAEGLGVPEKVYDVRTIPGGGLLAKIGATEFFLEDAPAGQCVSRISEAAKARPGIYELLRQDASILLSGAGAVDVLRQTCGYEFHLPASEPAVVMTRVAGVSCAVLARELGAIALFQFWLDGTYGVYLWETMLDIARESGGDVVGVEGFFPDVVSDLTATRERANA